MILLKKKLFKKFKLSMGLETGSSLISSNNNRGKWTVTVMTQKIMIERRERESQQKNKKNIKLLSNMKQL